MPEPSKMATEDWLRERFAVPREVTPFTNGDGLLFDPKRELRHAAVLLPVVKRDAGLTLLFTKRTDHLYDHAGQISFPGGRAEPEDGSPTNTALRETEEEIGLAASHVEVIGHLPEYLTVTGYRVTPVVGLVTAPFSLDLDDFEVAEAFEVPLAFLLDPVNHQRHTLKMQGRTRHYYAMPYEMRYIWGATAGMLMNFHAFLSE